MRSGVLAFVAAMLVVPAAQVQPRPGPATPGAATTAQPAPGPTTAEQLALAWNYMMMLYAVQSLASGPPVTQAQADSVVHDYLTNGAKATAVPTSGPAAAYFHNGGEAVTQVTLDIGNATRPVPEGGAPAQPGGASPTGAIPTATGAGTAAPPGTATAAPTATGAATATPNATPNATATPPAIPTGTATPTAAPTATATPTAAVPATTPTAEAPAATPAAPTVATGPVANVQPVPAQPAPAPAAPQTAVPHASGAAWAAVFAAGAALGALLVAIGTRLRLPRRNVAA